MEKGLLETIRQETQAPRIAIIGATQPTEEYYPKQGHNVGYWLRQYIEDKKGTLFTGGVEGVGVDIYTGIIKYHLNYLLKTKKLPEERFFVLVPTNTRFRNGDNSFSLPYQIPQSYRCLPSLFNQDLKVIRAGDNMAERREYLSNVADAVVVLNGSGGTLEEAFFSLKQGKKVLPIPITGGAALDLVKIKNDPGFIANIQFADITRIDTSNIIPIKSFDELRIALDAFQ
jgi:predicted Rossmann-fold nucleotide-binding protein